MSQVAVSPNKTIARNTIFLYVRMIVTTVISLYTSRALLQTLGVEDFGLYGLIGGIVAMFASFKSMFTIATQRFLNIEIGNGNAYELNKVFNVSVLVNVLIAVVFFIIVEIAGLWLLGHKLHIEPERLSTANWLFQISVVASLVQIFNVPYEADIIAREKMNVFATVTIFDAVAKLLIVLILPLFKNNQLIIYGILLCVVICVNLCINMVYCHLKFTESHFHRFSLLEIRAKFKEMFTFSSWAFFGNIVFALVHEGVNILLNVFGNLAANAARTITYQVRSALSNVVSNVYVAIKPQAIQSYAKLDVGRFYSLMFTGGKIVGYMYILMAIPLYFSLNEVIHLWLGNVPEYVEAFISASLVYQFVRVLHESVDVFFVTIGRLKEYQITEFFVQGATLPLSYIGLSLFNMPLYGVFLLMAFCELINLIVILLLAKKIGNFDVNNYLKSVVSPYVLMTMISFCCVFLIKWIFSRIAFSVTLKAIIFVAIAVLMQLLILYYLGLTKDEKRLFLTMINQFKRR